ncbi:MarR family winged helix-turn-helix transcriptional regulator [Alloyangia pacifica]|uniref:MarR family transcriptional regulator, transcriptional regulator for hemolysin n=1 Tax=Alloyangia pacifica TaxID=311180 RepID=A0A1I6PHJ7_9RHOB|nr:MarR family transcriptional regulator [Alloyangia pacifica]SDG27926.1 MarR family transcriptional regulator, transcriptional regulator for hemolysin [Alloyangia pacifica]SFS39629.1 MarR family transcriptional regulator, transcriptional regulator for hemolysin [Alloyangia pacifica]
MSDIQTQTRLLEALLEVMREIRTHYDASAQEVGLTLSRARVVSELARREGATQAELACALRIEAPALKRQIDALEAAGFIERRALDGDARKRALHLTQKARSSKITGFLERVRAELLEGISPEDQAAAQRTLERIALNATGLTSQ